MLFESLNENRIEMLQYIRIKFTIKTPRLNTINVLSHKECEENLHIYINLRWKIPFKILRSSYLKAIKMF